MGRSMRGLGGGDVGGSLECNREEMEFLVAYEGETALQEACNRSC